ncbi:hypothetical protein C7T94_04090 [Pedobacter yulinensis]|uniref:Aminoglycoside phosphotransferase domain-containing protein n=1 Tax=Pedobacter yulinensis TaxID=2126353 RepID=A0A2T3HNG9_9SPHI|nr:hypothetical protein [Pedobacter yulinensis]PST83931.1 hypothetical protein C7T94_04090 [Pedobacter yulinensis]
MRRTSTDSAPVSISGTHAGAVAQLVAHAFGPGWRISGWTKLNHKTEVRVLRLGLAGPPGAETKSVILKCAARYPVSGRYPSDFLEEQLNYQYLSRLRPGFERFPASLAQHQGLLLMEDLGPDTYGFNSLEEIVDALVGTLHNLHDSSYGTEQLYLELRAAAGLGDDERRYSAMGCARMFQKGCDQLSEFFTLLGLRQEQLLNRSLAEAGRLILSPGPFWSFVHDDLADRRQSVVLNGTIKLLDFEHGKFFHRLIDLAKLLMGKIERDNDKKAMIYHHPNVPTGIGEVYYTRWAQSAAAPGRSEFTHHFAAANIFQTMLIIGRLSELQGAEVLYSTAGNLKMILPRLVHHLEQGAPGHFQELKALLVMFCSRIMI